MKILKLPTAEDPVLEGVSRLQRLYHLLAEEYDKIPPVEGDCTGGLPGDKYPPPTFAEMVAVVEHRGKRRNP